MLSSLGVRKKQVLVLLGVTPAAILMEKGIVYSYFTVGGMSCPGPRVVSFVPRHKENLLPVTVGGRRAKPTSHVYGFIACGVLPCTGEFGTKVRCTVVSVVPHRGIVHRSTFLASRSSSPRRSSLSARRVCMCPDVCDRGNLVHGCLLVKEKGPVGLWKVR